ncbi:hypothetical protein BY458DRAFT_472795 [Sporodiniella umbellata]|nr:hypothetical protein BY458DRAFT_472795 [Sporodiniella umbellata]
MTSVIRQQQRQFFSLPNFLSTQRQYSERKLLNFSQNQLYNVVSNIDDYHRFVPFCTHSKVYSQQTVTASTVVLQAELGVGFKLFKEKYMSKVTCQKPRLVQAVAADGSLFNDMITRWQFTPNTSSLEAADYPSCWVDFSIEFDFASPLHAQTSSVFFDKVSSLTLQAFIDRCEHVYRHT